MAGPVMCECGAILLDDVNEQGVLLLGSRERIAFRRGTDHVVCERCMRSYAVPDLLGRASTPEMTEQIELLLMRIERDDDQG